MPGWCGPWRAHALGAAFPSPEALVLLQTSLPSSSAGPTRTVSAQGNAPEWSTTRPAVGSALADHDSGPSGWRPVVSPCDTTPRCPWRPPPHVALCPPTVPHALWAIGALHPPTLLPASTGAG